MNTFKKKSLYLAVAGVSALGAGCRERGDAQRGRPRSGAALPVLHGSRNVGGQRRTTRCCRSSTRRRRRRRSRSASWKARTPAKSLTSTCTCRTTTCGSRRSSRPPTAPASDAGQQLYRPGGLAGREQPERVRQLRVRRARPTTRRTTTRPYPRGLRRNHRDGRRCTGFGDVRTPRTSPACRATATTFARLGGAPPTVTRRSRRAACSAR